MQLLSTCSSTAATSFDLATLFMAVATACFSAFFRHLVLLLFFLRLSSSSGSAWFFLLDSSLELLLSFLHFSVEEGQPRFRSDARCAFYVN